VTSKPIAHDNTSVSMTWSSFPANAIFSTVSQRANIEWLQKNIVLLSSQLNRREVYIEKIQMGDISISPAASACNFGLIFDSHVSMKKNVPRGNVEVTSPGAKYVNTIYTCL
jgi:hypothetical protein